MMPPSSNPHSLAARASFTGFAIVAVPRLSLSSRMPATVGALAGLPSGVAVP